MLENGFNMSRPPLFTDLPFGECVDWEKHYLQCNHMFDVMKKFEMSWKSVSSRYGDSVFIKTDFCSR